MREKPNFIIVFMDDMGYGDMGCFGSSAIKTPVMDKLAAEGIRFTQMYSAAAICSPSRTALLTGRQPQRVGIERVLFPKDTIGIPASEKTMADDLAALGYRTVMAGKWHMGCLPEHNPVRHGFEEYFGLLYSNDMDPLHLYFNEKIAEREVDQSLVTRKYTDFVINFIRHHKDEPFLAYLAHTMPHIPLHVEKEFRGKSKAGTYGDTIECIDHHLGRLIDQVDTLGLRDDTFIVVTSDNGPWFEGSTGGLRGRKFELYEGGIRMPFVARYPAGIPAGKVCEEPASLMDLHPTFLHLAGGKVPEGRKLDGVDISNLLAGNGDVKRDALVFYDQYSPNAIRSGKWKLHVARGGKGTDRYQMPQLFDLSVDPEESYNVADLHPEIVHNLKEKLGQFHKGVCDDNPKCPREAPSLAP